MQSLDEQRRALDAGETTARGLVEACLARITDRAGQGARAFVAVDAARARAMADAMDALRRAGRAPDWAGVPIAVKDLFDVAGEVSAAGSLVLRDAPAAGRHAPAVARLLAAGMVPVGRTNMTEFAFSGLGVNPHHGTPLAPWRRDEGRLAGGSSSGSAVAVADGMATAALGTDTGGSCRVPAAFCGVTGYKPTARRVPVEGVVPLSPSLDSVGPLAPTVGCCAVLDALLAGERVRPLAALPIGGLRLALPVNVVLDDMDGAVAAGFARARARLASAGARIEEVRLAPFDEVAAVNALGGFAAAEAYAWHRALLARRGDEYDPRVAARIRRGAGQSAADYLDLCAARGRLIADLDAATAPYDALLMPTVAIVPPRLAEVEAETEYGRINLLTLRNTAIANFFDRCAISLPCHAPGEPPVGLMLMGETMGDRRLFEMARAVEAALAPL